MDKYMDARFERLEKALANLVDIITKNNASPALAHETFEADRELKSALEMLQTHQNNWVHILRLREETARLDAQIKSTVTSLWAMRREIAATPTTADATDKPKYDYTVKDLLDYARRIAPNTIPSPGVMNGLQARAINPTSPVAGQTQDTEAGATSAGPSRAATPMVAATGSFNNGTAPSAAPTPAESQPGLEQPVSQATAASTATSLPEHLVPAMNTMEGQLFIPFPTEDKLRRGALGTYQRLRDQGIDPRDYNPEEEARRQREEEEQRKEQEERQRLAREEHERRAREERERIIREREKARESEAQGPRRDSATAETSAPGPSRPERRQFQFMGGMDDDDDD